MSGSALADSGAQGSAAQAPGAVSGNLGEVPLHVPTQLCDNTIDVIGILNPAFGNVCRNGIGPLGPPPHQPPEEHQPPEHAQPHEPSAEPRPAPEPAAGREGDGRSGGAAPGAAPEVVHAADPGVAEPAAPEPMLARTGADQLGIAAGGGAVLLLGGALLLRRARTKRD
ncbi:chaplin [Streptomyces sp. MST-110588]|uniref:chaplin n=1 Tax=Streptomyces sp. MST-110588 TaxID=2833628 RepID=UPI001F5D16B7|nr:chaplin [Streptomyces sp. MST-110588]